MSSRKREIGQFQVMVALQGQKKVQKKSVMHLQGCCFAYLNVLLFCRSCCCPHGHCLMLPINSNIPQNSGSEQLGIKQQFSFRRWQC